MRKKMNLSSKLVLSITVLSMMSLIVLFIIINTRVRDMIVSYVHEGFEQSNILMSRDVDDWINHFKSLLDAKEIMAAELPRNILDDMALGFWERNDDIAISFFSHSARGTAASSVYGALPADWELFTRPWYTAARENPGQTAVRNPFWSVVEQTWATSVSRTTAFADGDEDVVSFTIILDAVFDKMGDFEIEGGGYVFLVGGDSVIVTHPSFTYTPDSELIPLQDLAAYADVLQNILGRENSIPFVTDYGVPSYIFTKPLDSSDWLMVSVVYASNINEVVNTLTTIVLVTVSAILGAMSVIVLAYVFRLIKAAVARSVTEFRESSASLAKGEELDMSRDRDNSFGLSEMFMDALNQMLEQKEQMQISESNNQAKSRFLANMSHEIRTPMNAILGITEIQLQRTNLDNEIREAFEKVYVSGDMLLGIVNDILDLSKIEDGKMELAVEKYEVASVINDTAVLNMMRIENKEVDFEISVEETMPAYLLGDELRIKQILNNVLSNAFKYTDEGKVKMSVSAKETGDGAVVLTIAVSDTGQGMSKEQVDKLFDAYSRFNRSANRFTEGTGLGMSITSNLINMMDGRISVESEPGKGSTVTVYLPQEKADDRQVGRETAQNLSASRAGSSAQMKRAHITKEPMPYGKILIVDDMEMNIYVAKGLMAPYEMQIDSAESGFAAIEKVEAGNEYDIIFMDHMMPQMDGIETTKRLRGMGYTLPIVALTANALTGQANMFLENGFDEFVSKPIDIRQLDLILNKLVRDKSGEKPRADDARLREAEALPARASDTQASENAAGGEDYAQYLLDAGIIDMVFQDFAETQKNSVQEIRAAVENNDFKTARHLAHTLKGVAGLISENTVVRLAQEAETALGRGIAPDDECITALGEEMERVLAMIAEKYGEE